LFLGYKPLIIGIVVKTGDATFNLLKSEVVIGLNFKSGSDESDVAQLSLKKINQIKLGEHSVFFYEGVNGIHTFLSPIHQWINQRIEKKIKAETGNADLDGNVYDQVRIAYSIPRTISVVTVSDGSNLNLFPADLHGPAGKSFYISSLRMNGLANVQVEKYRRIVLSEVNADQFRKVYALGKNHMKGLRDKNEFELDINSSEDFGFPLPPGVKRYRELSQINSFDHGIHRIHIYDVCNEHEISGLDSELAHIHSYYAQWRLKKRLATTFLIR